MQYLYVLENQKERGKKENNDGCIHVHMLDSGLRKSEIVRLSLSDLHILDGYLIVNGKGNKQRVVPVGLTVPQISFEIYYFPSVFRYRRQSFSY